MMQDDVVYSVSDKLGIREEGVGSKVSSVVAHPAAADKFVRVFNGSYSWKITTNKAKREETTGRMTFLFMRLLLRSVYLCVLTIKLYGQSL